MEQVGIAELKKRLSEYLERVKAGEEILVADRGRPVARLVPVNSLPLSDEVEQKRLLDMQRRGIIHLGSGKLPDDFWDRERLEDPESRVRAALQADRDEGW